MVGDFAQQPRYKGRGNLTGNTPVVIAPARGCNAPGVGGAQKRLGGQGRQGVWKKETVDRPPRTTSSAVSGGHSVRRYFVAFSFLPEGMNLSSIGCSNFEMQSLFMLVLRSSASVFSAS